MKTIQELEDSGMVGNDVSLNISLFEYGLAWGKNEHCTQENEYYFIYGIRAVSEYYRFDHGYLTLDDFKDILAWGELESICSVADTSYEELLKRFPWSVGDLMAYYGYENVFGSSYWEGFEIKEND